MSLRTTFLAASVVLALPLSARAQETQAGEFHSTATHTWTHKQVREAQFGLARAGLYHRGATGMINNETRHALRRFQRANHLKPTGELDDVTFTKLRDLAHRPNATVSDPETETQHGRAERPPRKPTSNPDDTP